MDRIIYVAATGAKAVQFRQDAVAHNLANLATPGFKAELAVHRTAPGIGEGYKTRAYAVESTPGADLSQGTVMTTENPMDVMVEQEKSWIAVQGADGQEAYLRTGTLLPNEAGELTLRNMPVLGEGGPMTVPPEHSIAIGRDGTVTATPLTGARGNTTIVGRIKMVSAEPGQLQRAPDGLFRSANRQPLEADEQARLATGKIEGSNVNPTEALVQMIAVARQYETQMRVLQTAQENSKSATALLGPG